MTLGGELVSLARSVMRGDGLAESDAAIDVSDVWKVFHLYRDRAANLKDKLIFWGREQVSEFWALQGVTLSIPGGKTVGIMGRNGSGKSTLLKVMSRILYPERGTVRVKGRVATLLELGAGFHPDFTGRENAYLNGSILGLTRSEVRRRLPDIADFAELGPFMDNPVRNYSSGMYMRLGFAIAIHANPDVLLVDEVLAVGDTAFQRKCLDRIRLLQSQGKTIVFVSHDVAAIQDLCDFAVWLDGGRLAGSGYPSKVVEQYLSAVQPTPSP